MSTPTRQFDRLSIGNMSTALAVAPDPSDSDGSESSSGEESGDVASESTSASVLAPSGITYDLSQLDSESEARAIVGLTGRFDVVNCRSTSAGYDFQLLDRPQVHIGPDASTCSCLVFQNRPDGACQHIFVSMPVVGKLGVGSTNPDEGTLTGRY